MKIVMFAGYFMITFVIFTIYSWAMIKASVFEDVLTSDKASPETFIALCIAFSLGAAGLMMVRKNKS